ncbi:hypothetical protein [Streptomyces sp. NPDC088923]|uniref:hypothetical protein n=1 Tax=Streptomyces sp. NPDC088923 TaxID=3365913 RepID=UPI00381C7E8F
MAILVVCVVVVAAGVLVAQAQGVFSSRGEITAEDVCRQVPERNKAVKTLREILPEGSVYTFEESGGPRADPRFHYFCFVKGEGGQFLMTLDVVPLSVDNDWKEWEYAAIDAVDPLYMKSLSPFPAGKYAVANSRVAAVADPCFYYTDRMDKTRYYMSTVVKARKPLDAADDKARQDLIQLAVNLGRKMHADARCEVPSQLPAA